MVEKSQGAAAEGENATPAVPAGATRRSGHRGMDPRETVAELTARAHEISQTAGSKVAAAMKEVIGAAAGLTGFAVESARDLVQYMVRRGQMTQMEGDQLLKEVEAAQGARKQAPRAAQSGATAPAAASAPKAAKAARKAADGDAEAKPAKKAKAAAEKPAAKKAAEKPATKASKKTEEKGPAKKQSAKGSASRNEAASRPRAASKSAPAAKKKKE